MIILHRFVLALLASAMLFAQTPASLRGTVTDPSGAGVPADRDQPGPAALAVQGDRRVAGQVQVVDGQPDRLGDPRPRAVQELQQRGVAQ